MLTFLKLGGALLTHKQLSRTVRPAALARLAGEVAGWPGTHDGQLILAHGSGSFAHRAVLSSGFLDHPDDPMAFALVAEAARDLNAKLVEALLAARVPAVGVPGSLLAACRDGTISRLRTDLIADLRAAHLLPVLYGDVAPDSVRGGAIASTEPLLVALAGALPPSRILLATDVDGVFPNPPGAASQVPDIGAASQASDIGLAPIPLLTPATFLALAPTLNAAGSHLTDVTGGMATKVRSMLALVQAMPTLEVLIFSGLRPGAVAAALRGEPMVGGTLIRADATTESIGRGN